MCYPCSDLLQFDKDVVMARLDKRASKIVR
jgi:uncharacterized protein (DUF779 family)